MALEVLPAQDHKQRTHCPFTGASLENWYRDDLTKQPNSFTQTSSELTIFGKDEKLVLPVFSSTQVCEIKGMLAQRLGIDSASLIFLTKQGCHMRKQLDIEEIARKVVVKGIPSFKRQRKAWEHPMVVIGAGHAGLRQAMWFLKHGDTNFVLYDRKQTVGGTSWWDQANKTSKLQTELGTYHLQYDEDNPVPTNLPPWPTRDQLLAHFKEVAEEYGVIPYCRFETDVKQVTVDKGDAKLKPANQWYVDQTYRFVLDNKGKRSEVCHSCICYFPGNLTVPREEAYKGEEEFGGYIEYAICNTVDYERVRGEEVALIGHGAFAVENVRTCCEFGVGKIWMVCRRKNLACPRVSSWLVNQSVNFLSGVLYMKSTEPMYNLTPFDPWKYHSVATNEQRTHMTINQKARFGIGDVYFLAIAMGLLEVIEDKVKRLSKGAVHLEGGRKLEVAVLFKLLGFNGAWEVDRLLGVKEMEGIWVNGDFRRFLFAEAIGVNANNFGGTSFSPGIRNLVEQSAHFFWYPKDFEGLVSTGMLPKHKAEPEKDRPAYVIDARHATATGMLISGCCIALAEAGGAIALLKHRKQLECHPMQKFVDQCREEWDEYARKWKENGAPGEIPPYPYTHELVQSFLDEEKRELALAAQRVGG
mmetsp:Transcript_17724/g.44887  ORF Transcript_17724/g.44887 Transcript_17724/m.44887 type:complete len:642 (+) Transcript_17724:61-1986(+)